VGLEPNVFVQLGYYGFFLLSDVVVEGSVLDVSLDGALHHGRPVVIFNITFPAGFWQSGALCETLLAEILDSVVVCIGQEIVDLIVTCMVL
jgi:hypothetical protein